MTYRSADCSLFCTVLSKQDDYSDGTVTGDFPDVGLGDRHTSNILMDNTSGEVVHIDLGIAFDQVRCSLLYVFPLCRSSNRENFCPSQGGSPSVSQVIW